MTFNKTRQLIIKHTPAYRLFCECIHVRARRISNGYALFSMIQNLLHVYAMTYNINVFLLIPREIKDNKNKYTFKNKLISLKVPTIVYIMLLKYVNAFVFLVSVTIIVAYKYLNSESVPEVNVLKKSIIT